MEPVEATVISFKAVVVDVVEKVRREYVSGFGDTTVFKNVSQGWYVILDGSYESLYVGEAKPNIRVGIVAMIRITFPCPA